MKEEDIRKRAVFDKYLRLVKQDSRKFFKIGNFVSILCPACASKDFEVQFTKNAFRYVRCDRCATLFVNPRPRAEEIKAFYVASQSSKFWVEKFFKPVAETRRKKIFRPRARLVRRIFPGMKQPIIGDIGAGFGLFLEELKLLIKEAKLIAIEPSPEMGSICRNKGFEVIPGFLEEIDKKYSNYFTIVTAFELFEHVTDPKGFLSKVHEILKPGGSFLFTTLNGEGFDIQELWNKSKSIAPPHHLNFFNPWSVKILLEKHKFKVTRIFTPGKLDWDIVEGAHVNDKADIGRFWSLVAAKASTRAKNELQAWIARNNFSSHMCVVATRIP